MSNKNIDLVNEKEIKQLLSKDFPNYARFAIANTASQVAYLGIKKSEAILKNDFTLRNKFIVSSKPGAGAIKYNKAIPHHNISKITSSWGSPEKVGTKDYSFLEDQEDGFINDSPIPTKDARVSKKNQKKIRRRNWFAGMSIMRTSKLGKSNATTDYGKVRHMLREGYNNGFGLPGSNQFFYMEDNEYLPGWSGGFFQFARKNTPAKNGLNYPTVRRIYYAGDSTKKKRRAKRWMEQSANSFTQAEIEKIYKIEADKAFTKGITKMF